MDRLGLSYHNARALNQSIDELPALASWDLTKLTLDGEEPFDLYHRDPVECLKALWANPVFMPYMSFEPERQYTDAAKKARRVNETKTGDFWWETQVCSILQTQTALTHIVVYFRWFFLMGRLLSPSS